MEYQVNNDSLMHYGVLGMKWGVRNAETRAKYANRGSGKGSKKPSYRSTSVRSALARRSNEKVDASFRNWNKNAKKKADAIELGKARNEKRMASELNPKDKGLRKEAKQANREYKKALRGNTTYRKGQIKSEVGKDLSRKYMTEAKRASKAGDRKTYQKFMNKHDTERASARRAPEVGVKRSRAIANVKRTATMTVKTAAVGAATVAGVSIANNYLAGKGVRLDAASVQNTIRNGKKFLSYIYL